MGDSKMSRRAAVRRSQLSEVGRGAAFGDIDNDGDVDVLVANNNGPPRLLINTVGSRNHWIGLRLVGKQANRDMLGARVEIVRRGRFDALAHGRDPMAATPRPTIRECSSDWDNRRTCLEFGWYGRMARPRSGAVSRSIGTPR